jgi:hypothetical protein
LAPAFPSGGTHGMELADALDEVDERPLPRCFGTMNSTTAMHQRRSRR